MPSFQSGTVNILGLTNPGVYVDVIPPSPFLVGNPTNIEGLVGVASWGPVGAVQRFSTPNGCAGIYGTAAIRPNDLPSYVLAAYQQGSGIGFAGVRVTDGTDTAAVATVQNSAGAFTARHTGSLGNQITAAFQNTAAIGAYAAIVSFPGRTPERFDNIYQALQSVTVAPGTGWTSVPTVIVPAPQKSGGVQATVRASLVALSAALATAGTGHAVNDVLTLGAGVTVKVLTIGANGVILTAQLMSPGSITSGSVPGTVGAQTATTGAGIGASFTLVFGLGPATFTSGAGYTAMPSTLTLQGGGGTGGSYTPVISFWAALAYAINNGTTQRAASNYVVFTPGSSTAVPVVNVPIALTGGTDGATGVTSAMLIGQDISPRTGMYALRNSGIDCFALCDVTDPTLWATQVAFGNSEAALPVTAMASGSQIADAVAARIAQGIDATQLWICVGDWPSFYDSQNSQSRLISPQAIAIGLAGNLSPEQSPINKDLVAVIATQTSQQGVLIADADESAAQTGGVDVIGRSGALNEGYFSFLTGRNASSNTAANGVEYTRLTNFIVRSLEGSATRAIIGRLQSTTRIDDPTRALAKGTLDSFFATLQDTATGSGGYGLIDTFATQCDLNNNIQQTIVQGFLFAYCQVGYLNVVRYFVVQLNAGGNVVVTVSDIAPTGA